MLANPKAQTPDDDMIIIDAIAKDIENDEILSEEIFDEIIKDESESTDHEVDYE